MRSYYFEINDKYLVSSTGENELFASAKILEDLSEDVYGFEIVKNIREISIGFLSALSFKTISVNELEDLAEKYAIAAGEDERLEYMKKENPDLYREKEVRNDMELAYQQKQMKKYGRELGIDK